MRGAGPSEATLARPSPGATHFQWISRNPACGIALCALQFAAARMSPPARIRGDRQDLFCPPRRSGTQSRRRDDSRTADN